MSKGILTGDQHYETLDPCYCGRHWEFHCSAQPLHVSLTIDRHLNHRSRGAISNHCIVRSNVYIYIFRFIRQITSPMGRRVTCRSNIVSTFVLSRLSASQTRSPQNNSWVPLRQMRYCTFFWPSITLCISALGGRLLNRGTSQYQPLYRLVITRLHYYTINTAVLYCYTITRLYYYAITL